MLIILFKLQDDYAASPSDKKPIPAHPHMLSAHGGGSAAGHPDK